METLPFVKKMVTLALTGILLALLPGCFGHGNAVVQRDMIALTQKVALVSVTMPRIADSSREANRAVLQASVNYAKEQALANLKTIRPWNVVEQSGAKMTKLLRSFGAVLDAELRSKFPSGDDAVNARKDLDDARARWKEQYLGADNLPIVPRSALIPEDESGKTVPQLQEIMLEQAGKLCSMLNVDAVVYVHVEATISHPRENAFMVKENRTDGMVRMAQTLVMVDKTGQIIADLGRPFIDDRAVNRDLLPLYVGAGRDAIKPENINLDDPKKKIAQALRSIIEETSVAMATELKEALKL